MPEANLMELTSAVARMEGRLEVLLWVAGVLLLLLLVAEVLFVLNWVHSSKLGHGRK